MMNWTNSYNEQNYIKRVLKPVFLVVIFGVFAGIIAVLFVHSHNHQILIILMIILLLLISIAPWVSRGIYLILSIQISEKTICITYYYYKEKVVVTCKKEEVIFIFKRQYKSRGFWEIIFFDGTKIKQHNFYLGSGINMIELFDKLDQFMPDKSMIDKTR